MADALPLEKTARPRPASWGEDDEETAEHSAHAPIAEDTPIHFSVKGLWGFLVGLTLLAGTVWGFHLNAINAISGKVEHLQAEEKAERQSDLSHYLKNETYQADRQQDQRYWDERLDQMEHRLTQEIRGLR